jgi:hypothetical protein
MKTKICFKCKKRKPLTDFYKHSEMKDGYLNKCKECARRDVSLNYSRNRKYYQEYEHIRNNTVERKQRAVYFSQKWKVNNPEKYKAHNKVNNALRDGKISRAERCEKCGAKEFLHKHHFDYNEPLNVIWLCARCHNKIHREETSIIPF